MTKTQLQKELLEKVKEGVKPSDLKRQSQKQVKKPVLSSPRSLSRSDEGYESDKSDKIPTAPPLPNSLPAQITSLKKQLQLYKDFKEADLKVKEGYKETINKLHEENKDLKQTIKELKNQTKNPAKVKETKEIGTQTEAKKTFEIKNYSCQICFEDRKGGIPSQLLRVKGLGGERNKKI
jgi:hypothetical protein